MHIPPREIVRIPLSLLTRLRLVLFGHEDLAGIIFWAALVGICGALASVALGSRGRPSPGRAVPCGCHYLPRIITGLTGLRHG